MALAPRLTMLPRTTKALVWRGKVTFQDERWDTAESGLRESHAFVTLCHDDADHGSRGPAHPCRISGARLREVRRASSQHFPPGKTRCQSPPTFTTTSHCRLVSVATHFPSSSYPSHNSSLLHQGRLPSRWPPATSRSSRGSTTLTTPLRPRLQATSPTNGTRLSWSACLLLDVLPSSVLHTSSSRG
jgi:hypothetical protein